MDSLRGGVIKHRPRNRVPAMCLWIPRCGGRTSLPWPGRASRRPCEEWASSHRDRKSTRLNSSHVSISYAVFCLKKKKKQKNNILSKKKKKKNKQTTKS